MALVTPEQIAAYDRDGIVHIPGVFKDWPATLMCALDDVANRAAASPEPLKPLSRIDVAPNATYQPLIVDRGSFGDLTIINAVAYDERFVRFIEDSVAAELACRVTKAKRVSVWQDGSFIKDTSGSGNGTPWHNDYCTWPFFGYQVPIVWVALTDIDPDNAPLHTVLGSHKTSHRYYSWIANPGLQPNEDYRDWQELLDKAQAADAPVKAWSVKAGDALVFHANLLHGSAPRVTTKPGRRAAFSIRFLGEDVIWNPDKYCINNGVENVADRMTVGKNPPEDLFPIVWRMPEKVFA